MQVEMDIEVLAAEDGVIIELAAGKGLNGEGMLEFDRHFDGLLDVY